MVHTRQTLQALWLGAMMALAGACANADSVATIQVGSGGGAGPGSTGESLDGGITLNPPPNGLGQVDAGSLGAPDAGIDPKLTVPTTPTDLKVFTGGATIALRWKGSVGPRPIDYYQVFRNGQVVGTVKPGFHSDFPEEYGNGFVDPDVTPGQQVTYKVWAVDTDDVRSDYSVNLPVTAPMPITPAPVVIVTAPPDLTVWATTVVQPFIQSWYPKVADLLAGRSFQPPNTLNLVVDPNVSGSGSTTFDTNTIVLGADYSRSHPQDLGLVSHLLTYIITKGNMPGWAASGLSDYSREDVIHDREPTSPVGIGGSSYLSGFGQASFFLNYLQEKVDPGLLGALVAASHANTYSDALFAQRTGKTLPQLWQQLTGQSTTGPGAILFKSGAGKCLDNGWSRSSNNQVQLWACDGSASQQWLVSHSSDGTVNLTNGGFCLDVRHSGTANGSAVQIFTCNGTGAQLWKPLPSGQLLNPESGRCLNNPGNNLTNGSALELRDCGVTASQIFQLP